MDNRLIIANRLADPNDPRPHESDAFGPQGFPYGYGGNHPSVLGPAFLATYTKKDPNTIAVADDYTTTLFDEIPRINWRLTYNGLSKLNMFKDIFESINITHGYQSRLTVSSFESNFEYESGVQTYDQSVFNYLSRFQRKMMNCHLVGLN